MGFFALAIVGWFSDVPPLTCALRALAGAAAMYVVVRVAGRIVMNIMVDAVMRSLTQGRGRREAGE